MYYSPSRVITTISHPARVSTVLSPTKIVIRSSLVEDDDYISPIKSKTYHPADAPQSKSSSKVQLKSNKSLNKDKKQENEGFEVHQWKDDVEGYEKQSHIDFGKNQSIGEEDSLKEESQGDPEQKNALSNTQSLKKMKLSQLNSKVSFDQKSNKKEADGDQANSEDENITEDKPVKKVIASTASKSKLSKTTSGKDATPREEEAEAEDDKGQD